MMGELFMLTDSNKEKLTISHSEMLEFGEVMNDSKSKPTKDNKSSIIVLHSVDAHIYITNPL